MGLLMQTYVKHGWYDVFGIENQIIIYIYIYIYIHIHVQNAVVGFNFSYVLISMDLLNEVAYIYMHLRSTLGQLYIDLRSIYAWISSEQCVQQQCVWFVRSFNIGHLRFSYRNPRGIADKKKKKKKFKRRFLSHHKSQRRDIWRTGKPVISCFSPNFVDRSVPYEAKQRRAKFR